MSKAMETEKLFKEGFNCSQAIFATYAPDYGCSREAALKLAGPLGGGIGRMAGTCGAVTGALLVIGLKYGTTSLDTELKKIGFAKVNEFLTMFKLKNKSCICSDLLGHDISTEDGLRTAREINLFATICPTLVKDAAVILEELL